jgi:hypothetical protein
MKLLLDNFMPLWRLIGRKIQLHGSLALENLLSPLLSLQLHVKSTMKELKMGSMLGILMLYLLIIVEASTSKINIMVMGPSMA